MVSAKLFLWPLARMGGGDATSAAGRRGGSLGAALTLGSWATIGFAGFRTFPELLSEIHEQTQLLDRGRRRVARPRLERRPARCARRGGAASRFGRSLRVVRATTSGRSSLAIGAALALSPIVWLHYLVLLAVPLGIARPRFSPLWLLPIVLWVCPRSGNGDGLETFLPAAVTAIVLGLLLVVRAASRSRWPWWRRDRGARKRHSGVRSRRIWSESSGTRRSFSAGRCLRSR